MMTARFPAAASAASSTGAGVSLVRLYILRVTYFLIAALMGTQIWPLIIHHAKPWNLMHGVAMSMLGAVTGLALLGIRYPLQMLPLLFVETAWKATWLIAVAYPLWTAHQIDAETADTVKACLMGMVLFPVAIPWPYVFANYVKKPGDRWTTLTAQAAAQFYPGLFDWRSPG